METILDQPYVSAKDIQKLVPGITIGAARKIVKEIREQMIEENAYIIQSKEHLVPTKRVCKLLKI